MICVYFCEDSWQQGNWITTACVYKHVLTALLFPVLHIVDACHTLWAQMQYGVQNGHVSFKNICMLFIHLAPSLHNLLRYVHSIWSCMSCQQVQQKVSASLGSREQTTGYRELLQKNDGSQSKADWYYCSVGRFEFQIHYCLKHKKGWLSCHPCTGYNMGWLSTFVCCWGSEKHFDVLCITLSLFLWEYLCLYLEESAI